MNYPLSLTSIMSASGAESKQSLEDIQAVEVGLSLLGVYFLLSRSQYAPPASATKGAMNVQSGVKRSPSCKRMNVY
jgi:hypothetical protein